MRRVTFALIVLICATAAVAADDPCPCVPKPDTWVATTCDTWNCAVGALVSANGDPLTFALPQGAVDKRWIVLRRVVGGSYVENPLDAHQVEQFDRLDPAIARLTGISADYKPIIVSAPDGNFLILSLRAPDGPHRRAVQH